MSTSAPQLDPTRTAANASAHLTARDLFIAFRERLVVTVPLALLVAILYVYIKQDTQPLYRSETTLQAERPERIVTSQAVVDTNVNSDVEFNTYLQLLSAETLRERVLKSLTPAEVARLTPPPGPDSQPRGPDLGQVNVQAVNRTLIIRITVVHRDPAAAALIANRYAEQFILKLLGDIGGKNEFAVDYLRQRAQELLGEATAAEQRLQDYTRAHNLVSLDNSTNITANRLNVVSSTLQGARLERLAIEEQCSLIDQQRRAGRNLLEIAAISRHGSVAEYASQVERLRRDESLLRETYLGKHPRIVAVTKAIETAQAQLSAAIDLAIAELNAARTKARETERNLQEEFALQEKELFRLRDLAVDYKGLESKAQVAKASYAAILARLNEAATGKALAKAPVSIVDRARPTSTPFTPDLHQITRHAIMFALAVIALGTVVLAHFDDRLKSTHDIEHILGEHVLGLLPKIRHTGENERYRLVTESKNTGLIEPFMNLHATVNLNSGIRFPKSVLITSTIPGEGKTMVSANLAAAFASHGKRVLLVDCDLRRPMLHERLDQANDRGLLRWYQDRGDAAPEGSDGDLLGIRRIAPNFHLLTSGGRSHHPTPLFEAPEFGALIAHLKTQFDLVLIDTPPLGAVSDALYISRFTDEFIYVCRFNRALRRHIRLNLRMLRSGPCRGLGLVLNDISLSSLGYYSDYRYYSSYNKYYGQAA